MKRLIIITSAIFLLSGVANADLIAYYPFSGNPNDESGNGNHGTVFGAKLTTDRFGNSGYAYNFDGVNDYIKTETNPMFTSIPFTVSAWILPREYKMAGIVEARSEVILTHYSWSFKWRVVEENLYFQIYDDTSTGHPIQFPNIPLNEWSFLTATYDGNEGNAYLNGVEVGSFLGGSDILNLVTSLKIGLSESPVSSTYNEYFNGKIDDVRIYDHLLSTSDIQGLYNEPNPVPEPNSLLLLSCSLIGLIGFRRRFRRR